MPQINRQNVIHSIEEVPINVIAIIAAVIDAHYPVTVSFVAQQASFCFRAVRPNFRHFAVGREYDVRQLAVVNVHHTGEWPYPKTPVRRHRSHNAVPA